MKKLIFERLHCFISSMDAIKYDYTCLFSDRFGRFAADTQYGTASHKITDVWVSVNGVG